MPFRPDSPVELPNGRLVCGSHHLVVCPFCTVDYSFMEEISDEDQEASEDSQDSQDEDMSDEERTFDDMTRLRVGTGRVIPTNSTLEAPGILPSHCSHLESALTPPHTYPDGACLDNGGANPKAGCGIVFKPDDAGHLPFPLENEGPTGEAHPQTSNRAELCAVIAALRFRFWTGEGFNSLVIATDSEYVVEGVTSWVRGWIRRGWKTSMGAAVKNRDLWECLLGEMEKWDDNGMQVKFWRTPRDWNTDADCHARHAASEDTRGGFRDIKGILV